MKTWARCSPSRRCGSPRSYWPGVRGIDASDCSHFSWLYLIQQSGTYGLLGFSFGRSLAAGHVPLCTRFATLAHGSLAPDAVRYTRTVTLAWTIFFCAMSAAVLIVYVAAPLRAWSVFTNFCTAPLVGLMFIGEYLVRLRVLPDMQHASILGTVRATMRSHS